MVASREVEIPFYRGVGRQRGRKFVAPAQVIGTNAIPFLRKYIVPAAKRLGADLLEIAASEFAEVVSGRKNFKTAAKSVGGQTLRKQLGSGSKKEEGSHRCTASKQIHSNKICTTNQSVAKRQFYKHFSLIMSSNFRYQPFVAVSGRLGGKVPVVDDVLSSHEKEIYPTNSLNENCKEFEFRTDRNYYVHLRQTYLALKLKLVRGRGYETYKTKEVKNEQKEEAKAEEEETSEEEAPVPFVTHVNNILHSIFSIVEVYINNQQMYKSNGLYVHKSCNSNNFKGAISEYKGVLHCEGYDYEEFPNEIMEAPLAEPFFTRRMKMFSRPDGFMLYGNLGVDFFSTSELLHPIMKIRLQLIRARPKFYMIIDNPNVSLGIVDCSLYTRRIALKDDYHKKRMDMLAHTPVEFNYLETNAKTFIIPATQNQFIQENIFNNAPVRRIAIAMNTNYAFTGSCTEKLFWYQQFDLRQIRILRGGQPIVDFDAVESCRLYFTTKKAMNFQDEIPSIPIDNFKENYVLVFDLTSMQDVTENCHYPELVGEPLRLELNLTFPLEHVTELIVLGERMSSVAVDQFGVVGENI